MVRQDVPPLAKSSARPVSAERDYGVCATILLWVTGESTSMSGAVGFVMESVWLTATIVGLLCVAGLGVVMALLFHLSRRFRWVSPDSEFQVYRTLRVTFGTSVLAAAVLPYLVVHFPLAAVFVSLMIFGVLGTQFLYNEEQTIDSEPPIG